MDLEDIIVKTVVCNKDGTELTYAYQTFIEHMGGDFGNTFQVINADGDLELIVYTTKVERVTQQLSAVGTMLKATTSHLKNAQPSPPNNVKDEDE